MKKSIIIFLGITFLMSWVTQVVAYISGLRYGDSVFNWILNIISIIPAIAMIVARYFCREGFSQNVFIKPNLVGNIRSYLFAYMFPLMVILIGAFAFFTLFPQSYDPLAETYLTALVRAGQDPDTASSILMGQIVVTVIFGPFVNIIFTFAEELGFRGYLLIRINGMLKGRGSALKASLITSFLWGVWYIPQYLQGHNYGTGYEGFPILGILVGLLFQTALGIVLSYLTFKTGSVFPAALARSGILSLAALSLFFSRGETMLIVGPGVYGIIGQVGVIVFALIYSLRTIRMQAKGDLFFEKS